MNQEDVIRILDTDRTRLMAYVRSMVHDHHLTEDLFQDLLVVAIQQVESFHDADHLKKWARATLRNKGLDRLRKLRRQSTSLDADVLESLESHWSASHLIDSPDIIDALRHCLSQLTPKAQQLVQLRYGQGLRGTDIAQATDRKLQTVYVALSRAYKALADCITDRLAERPNHA